MFVYAPLGVITLFATGCYWALDRLLGRDSPGAKATVGSWFASRHEGWMEAGIGSRVLASYLAAVLLLVAIGAVTDVGGGGSP